MLVTLCAGCGHVWVTLSPVGRCLWSFVINAVPCCLLQENVDLASVQLRGKSFTDKEELLPLCYRCSTVNPLVNTRGSRCTNCNQPFVFSFVSFGGWGVAVCGAVACICRRGSSG